MVEVLDHLITAGKEIGPISVALMLLSGAIFVGLASIFAWGLQRLYHSSSALDGHAGREEEMIQELVKTSNGQQQILVLMNERHERFEELHEKQIDTLGRLSEGVSELLIRSRIMESLRTPEVHALRKRKAPLKTAKSRSKRK